MPFGPAPEELAAAHGAADDEVMIAPRVVGADDAARSRRLQRAAEVRERERGDLPVDAELDRRVVERLDRLARPAASRFACVLT